MRRERPLLVYFQDSALHNQVTMTMVLVVITSPKEQESRQSLGKGRMPIVSQSKL